MEALLVGGIVDEQLPREEISARQVQRRARREAFLREVALAAVGEARVQAAVVRAGAVGVEEDGLLVVTARRPEPADLQIGAARADPRGRRRLPL
eukprot:5562087-Prymnesium_polylepis.1